MERASINISCGNRAPGQKGFTLIEMAITVFVIGVITAAVSPFISSAASAYESRIKAENRLMNVQIAEVLLDRAQLNADLALPDPDATGEWESAPVTPGSGDTQLLQLVNQAGLNVDRVPHDGRKVRNQRVYQKVTGLSASIPLYMNSGPAVNITYEGGVIYNTMAEPGSALNADGLPGDSEVITPANMTTWQTVGEDYGAHHFSNLLLHQARLQELNQKLNKVRDKFLGHYRFEQNQATGTAIFTDNHFPDSGGVFVDLSADTILSSMGLSDSLDGVTPWGAGIYYCSNYDSASGSCVGHNDGDAPYSAAFALPENISTTGWGGPPDNHVIYAF